MTSDLLERSTKSDWIASPNDDETTGNGLIVRRALECLGLCMIGDGALAVAEPTRHVALWLRGPVWWQSLMRPFVERPQLTRFLGAAELALGFWLASQQTPPSDEGFQR